MVRMGKDERAGLGTRLGASRPGNRRSLGGSRPHGHRLVQLRSRSFGGLLPRRLRWPPGGHPRHRGRGGPSRPPRSRAAAPSPSS